MANLALIFLASMFFLPGLAASDQSYNVDLFQISHNESQEVIKGTDSGTGDLFWQTYSTDPSTQNELFRFELLTGESTKISNIDQSQTVRQISPNNDVLYQQYDGGYSLYVKNSFLQKTVLLSKSSNDGDMSDNGDVVWSEGSNIFFYEHTSGTIEHIPSPVAFNGLPLIDNNQNILWLGSALDGSSQITQVFRYDSSTSETKQLSNFQDNKNTSLWINRNGDALWQRLTIQYSYVNIPIPERVLSYYKAEYYNYNAEANNSRMIFSLDTLDSRYSRFKLQQNGDILFTIPGPTTTLDKQVNDLYRYEQMSSEIKCQGRLYGSVAVSLSDSGHACTKAWNGISVFDSQHKQIYNLISPDSINLFYPFISDTGQIYSAGRLSNQNLSSLYEIYLVNKPEITDTRDGGSCAEISNDNIDEVNDPLPLTPNEFLYSIAIKIEGLNIPKAIGISYLANLNSAKKFIVDKKITPSIKQVETFTQKVTQDLKHGKISSVDAEDLMEMANQLLTLLNQ